MRGYKIVYLNTKVIFKPRVLSYDNTFSHECKFISDNQYTIPRDAKLDGL